MLFLLFASLNNILIFRAHTELSSQGFPSDNAFFFTRSVFNFKPYNAFDSSEPHSFDITFQLVLLGNHLGSDALKYRNSFSFFLLEFKNKVKSPLQ